MNEADLSISVDKKIKIVFDEQGRFNLFDEQENFIVFDQQGRFILLDELSPLGELVSWCSL